MKKALPVLAVVLIFVLGLGIMLYPAVANYLNAQSQTVAIDQYEEAARANTAYYEGLLEQAQAFNEGVLKRGTLAVMTEAEKAEYNSLLNLNGDGVMGYIEIPKLDLRLSIAHGTDEDVLQKMVGHVEGTSLPVGGESTHAVLSAHRGLPTAKLFSDLDLMQVGDRFTIYTLNQALTYQVDQITVILPEEIEALAIEPGKDYVTLMTCTPYAVNTHRLLVRGVRVPDDAPTPEPESEPEKEPLVTPIPNVTPRPDNPIALMYSDGEWVYLDEYGIPLGALEVPKTGDESDLLLYAGVGLLLLFCAGAMGFALYRRRRHA